MRTDINYKNYIFGSKKGLKLKNILLHFSLSFYLWKFYCNFFSPFHQHYLWNGSRWYRITGFPIKHFFFLTFTYIIHCEFRCAIFGVRSFFTVSVNSFAPSFTDLSATIQTASVEPWTNGARFRVTDTVTSLLPLEYHWSRCAKLHRIIHLHRLVAREKDVLEKTRFVQEGRDVLKNITWG